jgi:hypothetical protein
MILSNRHINALTIFLLVGLLCLPVYGPDYFSEYLSAVEATHTGFVCADTGADADFDHESRDGHRHITHCHELDAPCDTPSGLVLDYSPVISALTSSDKGTLLDGYDAPFDIPPEHRV